MLAFLVLLVFILIELDGWLEIVNRHDCFSMALRSLVPGRLPLCSVKSLLDTTYKERPTHSSLLIQLTYIYYNHNVKDRHCCQ
jgi:hypothetical protein